MLREGLKSINSWNSNFLWFQGQRSEIKHIWSQKDNGHYEKLCIYVKMFLIMRNFCHKYANCRWTCFFLLWAWQRLVPNFYLSNHKITSCYCCHPPDKPPQTLLFLTYLSYAHKKCKFDIKWVLNIPQKTIHII